MAKINRKKVWEKAQKMNNAWQQGAPSVKFMDISQSQLNDKITAIVDKQTLRDDLLTQAGLLDDEITDMFVDLDETTVNVRSGVVGDRIYGDNSPLYGEMGFVRKEERKSGLHRAKAVI